MPNVREVARLSVAHRQLEGRRLPGAARQHAQHPAELLFWGVGGHLRTDRSRVRGSFRSES